jgi:alpha-L-glutamate ligase-like protein
MFSLNKRLRGQGVLSINQRNSDFVLRYNKRKYFPLVDDKLKTKQLAIEAGIAVPSLYGVIHTEHEINDLEKILTPYNDFVIKPAQGSGGDGIIVFVGRALNRFRQINGKLYSTQELSYHISCILSGAYSLGGHPDCAMIERRVIVDPVFSEVSYEGIPDIRIITLLGYPAMAMVRLPTRLSGGKANLHQGAIGIGINLSTGKTLGGVFHNDAIDFHPDTLNPIVDIQVPYWDKILDIAARCYELTQLGYLGVDIVLDKDAGPLLLELNARPGLNIQIANREGVLHRYRAIEHRVAACKTPESPAERIAFSRSHFKR